MVMVTTTPATVSVPGKSRLRLWIRLLRAAKSVEARLRERLAAEFETTLPRFDVMSALDREPDGMMMSQLSRYLLVSNGNVTGIVDRLVSDRLVVRMVRDDDRRASVVRLTGEGRALFAQMAAAHADWIEELLAEVSDAEAETLATMLRPFNSKWEQSQ